MKLETICEDLKRHEGFRSEVYQDSLGYWTIGYGRLVDSGGGITKDEALMLLENDITYAYNALSNRLDFFDRLPAQVQRALINMAFQLGLEGLMRFRNTLKYIEKGEYKKAAKEALNSLWAKQTPKRAKEVTGWMANG